MIKDPKQLTKVITAYKLHNPVYKPAQKKGILDIAQYFERVKAATELAMRQKGTMMWEGYFIEFYQKPKGAAILNKKPEKSGLRCCEKPKQDSG